MLQEDFCPPIDASLFSAIASDYDLSIASSFQELRSTLETLRKSALAEEGAAFDPSGSSGAQDDLSSHGSSEKAQSWHGDAASMSGGTEDTDLSGTSLALKETDLDDFEIHSNQNLQINEDLERIPPLEKDVLLKEMFPGAKDFDVNYTLKKAGNNFSRAVEDLLNQAFLEDESVNSGGQVLMKGIEGFSENVVNSRGRRRKGKKKQLLRRTSSTPAPLDDKTCNSPTPLSRWDRAKEDIDFIAQRTYISPTSIASIYHKSGASLPATITALCNIEPNNPSLADSDPSALESYTANLSIEFPTFLLSQLTALTNLTHPYAGSARDLAQVLATPTINAPAKLIPQYLPRPPSPTQKTSLHPPTSHLPHPSPTAAALATTRATALTQAATAHRKSKSTPHFAGAAAHYNSVARSATASLRAHEAAGADALVAAQSRAGEVDLHGVSVKDGVRIAREKVEEWWAGRWEWAKEGRVRGVGLRVVTGVGRHSDGGRGKLGPAVGGMLVREGWRVEVGKGVVEVLGRGRR